MITSYILKICFPLYSHVSQNVFLIIEQKGKIIPLMKYFNIILLSIFFSLMSLNFFISSSNNLKIMSNNSISLPGCFFK